MRERASAAESPLASALSGLARWLRRAFLERSAFSMNRRAAIIEGYCLEAAPSEAPDAVMFALSATIEGSLAEPGEPVFLDIVKPVLLVEDTGVEAFRFEGSPLPGDAVERRPMLRAYRDSGDGVHYLPVDVEAWVRWGAPHTYRFAIPREMAQGARSVRLIVLRRGRIIVTSKRFRVDFDALGQGGAPTG